MLLTCCFPAEVSLPFFIIEIESDAYVAELWEAIQDKLRMHGQKVGIRYEDLLLFKTDVPINPMEDQQSRALQWLQQHQLANGHLVVSRKLTFYFPNSSSQSGNNLDIIVANTEVLDLVEGLGDPADPYKGRVRKALDRHFNRLASIPSPSDIVHSPKELADLFGDHEPPIHLGRPGGGPVAIFNPALAMLKYRLENLEQVQVSCSEVDRAADFLQCAVGFYKNKDLKALFVKERLDVSIRQKGKWRLALDWADNIKPDGSWWHNEFLILVLEFKNTFGLSGDALTQAIVDYSKIVSQKKYKRFREYCNFPIVLIGATANRLEISVAVCVGPIYVCKLLTLDLSLGPHVSDNIIRLARVFVALSHCLADLNMYYRGIGVLASPRLSCLFPNPTAVDPPEALPELVYRRFLSRAGQPTSVISDLGYATTALYIATLGDTDREVIVKFTANYNEAAHRLLADAGLAPKLHFCGRVIGGLYMIVMDRVDGKSIWQLREDKAPVPAIVLEKVEEALRLLHAEDIVFGDLRDPNILYAASEGRVVLVDFDGAGKDGKSRYPATLRVHGNVWPEEVIPYGFMRKDHDLWQLEQLKAVCNSGV